MENKNGLSRCVQSFKRCLYGCIASLSGLLAITMPCSPVQGRSSWPVALLIAAVSAFVCYKSFKEVLE